MLPQLRAQAARATFLQFPCQRAALSVPHPGSVPPAIQQRETLDVPGCQKPKLHPLTIGASGDSYAQGRPNLWIEQTCGCYPTTHPGSESRIQSENHQPCRYVED